MFYAPAVISNGCSSLAFFGGFFSFSSNNQFISTSFYDNFDLSERVNKLPFFNHGYNLSHHDVDDYKNSKSVIELLKKSDF